MNNWQQVTMAEARLLTEQSDFIHQEVDLFDESGSDEFIKKGGDYELCGLLINKDLDRFVEVLPRYYKIDKQLPRYYKEALIQYNHLRSNRQVNYEDEVLETDYQDMQRIEQQYSDPKAQQMAVFNHYEGTYWYFYAYLK